jgi:hypothetical protein
MRLSGSASDAPGLTASAPESSVVLSDFLFKFRSPGEVVRWQRPLRALPYFGELT